MEKARAVLPNVTYCADAYEAAIGADAILIVTEWDEFRQMDWQRLLAAVEQPLVIDGRNVFRPEEITLSGFRYVSIGRGDAIPSQATSGMEKIEPSFVAAKKEEREVPA
jgi:UDPglucose 6-dehydrogenase